MLTNRFLFQRSLLAGGCLLLVPPVTVAISRRKRKAEKGSAPPLSAYFTTYIRFTLFQMIKFSVPYASFHAVLKSSAAWIPFASAIYFPNKSALNVTLLMPPIRTSLTCAVVLKLAPNTAQSIFWLVNILCISNAVFPYYQYG